MQLQQIDNEHLRGQPSMSSRTRHNTWKLKSRTEKLKDKRITFPQSTLSKIVFISNSEGNGFRKQHLHFDNPSSSTTETINIHSMIDDINKACFMQWRDSLLAMQQQPLRKYDIFQSMVAVCVFMVGAALVGCIIMGLSEYMIKLAYVFIAFMFVICLCSLLLMREKRVEVNADRDMVRAIKTILVELNGLEEVKSPDRPRYLWTCHKDCLWIAIELR